MKNIRNIIVVLPLLFVTACNWMDIVPDMIATIEDNAFSMRSQAEKFFFTCYSYMPSTGSYTEDPALLGGDEIWLSTEYTAASHAKNLAMGNQNAGSPYFDYWRGVNGGRNLYRGISDCNIFLANIDQVPDINDAEKNRWKAEVEVLKAYYHFYLTRMYGPIPIKDKNLSIQDGTELTHVYRNTLDECFTYIVNKLDSVINLGHLPMTITDEANELGRITQGIAMTLKAKALVTAASPLFNGNTDYKGLSDKRGVEIFCPDKTEEQKQQLWAEAAKACKEAINFQTSIGKDNLYRYTSTEYPGLSNVTRAKLTIRGSLTEKWNDDIIWANTSNWPEVYQIQALPRDLDAGKSSSQTSGRNNYAVPIKILYQFYTKNGVPIEEDKTWNFNERFTVRTVDADQQYLLAVGQQTAGIHFDREIRYYASIGFDRGIWFGHGSTSETAQWPEVRAGEKTANQITHSWNVTGMWPKKVIHPRTTVSGTTTVTYIKYPFPIFRLPELYLMYAEALNEANNTQAARDEAIIYIDMVRERANLKGVAESWSNFSTDASKYQRQEGLRNIIRQETLIEFAFEGHRFWDLRRWKTALAEYNKPITGWNLLYNSPGEYYTETYLYTTKFSPRDYFWPIYNGEILRNSNTLQNFGW